MEAVDKAGYYRKGSKETPKARKAKSTKIKRPRTGERNHQEERKREGTKITRLRTEKRNHQEERKRGRHIYRMPSGRPLHSRCLGSLHLHQQTYDIDVYHLGNRHAAGVGVWQMNTIFTIYRFFKRNRENNGTQKIYTRATSDRCAPPNRWIRHAGRPVPSCRYEIVGDQDAQRVHPENRAAI